MTKKPKTGEVPKRDRTFERGPHDLGVPGAVKGVVDPPLGHPDDDLLDGLVVVQRVDAVRGTELHRSLETASE